MADLADRGLFLWNGASKGTSAVYEYMQSLDKPADLRTFKMSAASQGDPIPAQPKSARSKPAVIELIIDTSPVLFS